MMVRSALRTGLEGYRRNVQLMEKAATKLANPETAEPVRDIVDLMRAEAGAKANVITMVVAKRTEDFLLDLFA